jgi:hypothetical protein
VKGTYKGIFSMDRSSGGGPILCEFFMIISISGNVVGRTRKPARTIHDKTDARTLYRKGTSSNTILAYSVCIELLDDPKVLIALDFFKVCLAGLPRRRFELWARD